MADVVLFQCAKCGESSARDPSARFCPRCGHAWQGEPPASLKLSTPERAIDVGARLGEGTTARLYRCSTSDAPSTVSVLKIALDPLKNAAMQREASSLRALTLGSNASALAPFVPRVVESFSYVEEGGRPRQANVLRYDPRLGDPSTLYSLAEVRSVYADGIHVRDAAWMFRRLLHALTLAHAASIAHGAVVPSNILIEPADHKLVLVGWSDASPSGQKTRAGDDPVANAWLAAGDARSTAADLDLAFAARTYIDLVSGNARTMTPPDGFEPALARFLERCVTGRDVSGSLDGEKLLADFDRLIEVLWGLRVFRPFAMPPRATMG